MSRYPHNWRSISQRIRFERAGGKCEHCGAVHGEPHPITGKRTILLDRQASANPAHQEERYKAGVALVAVILRQLADEAEGLGDLANFLAWADSCVLA